MRNRFHYDANRSFGRFVLLGSIAGSALVFGLLGTGCQSGTSPHHIHDRDLIDISQVEKAPSNQEAGKVLNEGQTVECPGTENQPYAVVYPNGGEVFKVGDTIHLEFCTSFPDSFPISPDRRPSISISVDNGVVFYEIFEYLETNTIDYVIPDTLQATNLFGTETKTSTISQNCRIRLTDYQVQSIRDVSDAPFSIVDGTSSVGGSTGVIR